MVLANSRSLATTWEITVVFSSSSYLDVSVRRVRLPDYSGISRQVGMGCPIRTPADQRFFAAPHGFSQLGTSFIATVCLGIHRTPFYASVLHGLHKPPAWQTHTSTSTIMSSIILPRYFLILTICARAPTARMHYNIYYHYVKEHPARSPMAANKIATYRGVDPRMPGPSTPKGGHRVCYTLQ